MNKLMASAGLEKKKKRCNGINNDVLLALKVQNEICGLHSFDTIYLFFYKDNKQYTSFITIEATYTDNYICSA
jgi:hypothetical protein